MKTTTLRPAEFVLPGHPDKLCDAIADALVREGRRRQRRALCGLEVAVFRSSVFVTGRIACAGAESIDVPAVVRSVYASAGYGRAWGPAPEDLAVQADLCLGPLEDGEEEFRALADDQAVVTGYAADLPGTNYLPVEHWLAYRLSLAVARLRADRADLRLGPDAKVLAVVADEGDGDGVTAGPLTDGSGRYRLARLSLSLQQARGADAVETHRAVRAAVAAELAAAAEAVPGLDPAPPAEVAVNGAGDFAVGGPRADNGLSGKKLVADAYGPRVPIGGGALSGKDFFKADRAGALLARRLAKLVVLSGAAPECTATLGWQPGDREARVLGLSGPRGVPLPADRWARLVDLTLAAAGERFGGGADLVDVARFGHFTDPARPWEAMTLG